MLSIRMQAVADLVSDGMRIADIGTDHGFVPIALVSAGRCPYAVAADVRRGPLSHAAENIRKYGLSEVIETRLSDGLEKIKPGEADSIIIAGMGGMLMIRILEEGRLNDFLLESGAYNTNNEYIFSMDNILHCWRSLFLIAVVFAILAGIILSFIDKDKR